MDGDLQCEKRSDLPASEPGQVCPGEGAEPPGYPPGHQAVGRGCRDEGPISGHSLRVGFTQSLAAAGASLVEMQRMGHWGSPTMPGHYTWAGLASRGVVAKLSSKGRRQKLLLPCRSLCSSRRASLRPSLFHLNHEVNT